jgi:hypothetical protein
VERGVLPPEALGIIDAGSSISSAPGDVKALLSAAGRVLATVCRNEPRLGA